MNPPDFLTEQQLSLWLGISVYTLQKHRQRGIGLPFTRVGRRVLYSREAVLIRLQQHEKCGGSDAV